MWTLISVPQSRNYFCSFHVFFTYGTAAKWDQPQSHLAKHYKYLYIYIFICVCIYTYMYINLFMSNKY